MDISGTVSVTPAASVPMGVSLELRGAGSAIQKLTPSGDLECYYFIPSAIAALSQTSPNGFTLSGCWRQQFDWAVVEWNRDNVFEHPVFRNLPDGDLSGLQLSYQETRSNTIPLDSNLYATVDWPYLRVWADPGDGTGEHVYFIPLTNHAVPASGSYTPASATFELQGTATTGDYIELAWDQEHYTYQLYGIDTMDSALTALAASITQYSPTMQAAINGAHITLTLKDTTTGANGNRIGVYGNVFGAKTETWQPQWQLLSGGTSPSEWQVSLNCASIQGHQDTETGLMANVPMNATRKLRWTWAADLQTGNFARSEFVVTVSNWTVTGANRGYEVAGPGSWRVEDDDPSLQYTGSWTPSVGNYSGGSISYATATGASVSHTYQAPVTHTLYLGTREASGCAQISIQVDENPVQSVNLTLNGEDVLMRLSLGVLPGGVEHSVTITHNGPDGSYFYFDFLEIALPTTQIPVFLADPQTTLATDWDTLHSQALAPERTAWLIQALGFTGRSNHYAGALWFYELYQPGQQYATATVTFSGISTFGNTTNVLLGPTTLTHLNLIGDTPASLAMAFALLINEGSTEVWAQANGGVLTLTARAIGSGGNGLTISANTGTGTTLQAQVSGPLSGGVDANWLTDPTASPLINRAARDWSLSFFTALRAYGITPTAAFSMELGNGDPSATAGIAQCYPDGSPCMVNTPALQTNFSPASTAFWQEVYLEIASAMSAAGCQPYLQFGEVQWWYFPPPTDPANGNWNPITGGGMPFYDAYTTGTFQSQYGRAMHVFTDPGNDPTPYPQESAFLPSLIGQFTATIMAFVRQSYPNAQFEVLYPPDTNNAPLTSVINLPATWTPANLASFNTENFSYTLDRNLNQVQASLALPAQRGFTPQSSAHLVGISNYTAPWAKECRLAQGQKFGSVVLFALDQCCLIGYGLPLSAGPKRSLFMGA